MIHGPRHGVRVLQRHVNVVVAKGAPRAVSLEQRAHVLSEIHAPTTCLAIGAVRVDQATATTPCGHVHFVATPPAGRYGRPRATVGNHGARTRAVAPEPAPRDQVATADRARREVPDRPLLRTIHRGTVLYNPLPVLRAPPMLPRRRFARGHPALLSFPLTQNRRARLPQSQIMGVAEEQTVDLAPASMNATGTASHRLTPIYLSSPKPRLHRRELLCVGKSTLLARLHIALILGRINHLRGRIRFALFRIFGLRPNQMPDTLLNNH